MSIETRVNPKTDWTREQLEKQLYEAMDGEPGPYVFWEIAGHYRNLGEFKLSAQFYDFFIQEAPDNKRYQPYKSFAEKLRDRFNSQ